MYIQYDVDSIYRMMWILDFKHMVYGMLLAIKKKKYKVGFYSSDDSDGRERACWWFGTWMKDKCMKHLDSEMICYNLSNVT